MARTSPDPETSVFDARLKLLTDWVARTVTGDARDWFIDALRDAEGSGPALERALALAPRRLGRMPLVLAPSDMAAAQAARPGWDLDGLTLDQAARIALLIASARDDSFAERLRALARTAEINELIAYHRGLPLYPEPERLLGFASEGVRSGMEPVFEAVAHRNPYPRERFDDATWNQMVLKALFLGSRLAPIQGLDERANPDLARALVDYAEERLAAGRPVSPELWRCVEPFADAHTRAVRDRARRSGGR